MNAFPNRKSFTAVIASGDVSDAFPVGIVEVKPVQLHLALRFAGRFADQHGSYINVVTAEGFHFLDRHHEESRRQRIR